MDKQLAHVGRQLAHVGRIAGIHTLLLRVNAESARFSTEEFTIAPKSGSETLFKRPLRLAIWDLTLGT